MTKLENYLRESDLSIRNLGENKFKIIGEGLGVVLSGTCSENQLDVNIVSKAGQVLYPVNESFETEDNMLEKLNDVVDMFKQVSIIESNNSEDLDRDTEDKDIILDDAEVVVDNTIEETDDGYHSISDLLGDLKLIAEKSTALSLNVEIEDAKSKSVLIGLVAAIYSLIDDFEEFKEDLEEIDETKEVDESVVVAPKIDYIDLAKTGLSQAKYALEKLNKFKSFVSILEDIKSDLIISE